MSVEAKICGLSTPETVDAAVAAGARWVGFVLVWIALAVFTFEALTHRRRQLALAAEASAV